MCVIGDVYEMMLSPRLSHYKLDKIINSPVIAAYAFIKHYAFFIT